MLQHSSYISLWHIVLHLTIILATHEAGSLISPRIFLLSATNTLSSEIYAVISIIVRLENRTCFLIYTKLNCLCVNENSKLYQSLVHFSNLLS